MVVVAGVTTGVIEGIIVLALAAAPMRHSAGTILLALLVTPVLAALLLAPLRRAGLREQRRERGLCPACGYSLAGNQSGICPECGRPVDPERAVGR